MIEENIEEAQSNALPIGSMLREYEILSVLGQGGFGITYKALDTHLDAIMVIKEYMPSEFASRSNNSTVTCISNHKDTFEWGKQRFLEEAKVVKKFDHISIVKVLNLFEMNGTAYFVMDFYEGETLEDYLLRHPKKKFSQDEILSVMMPIIEGLKSVHAEGFLHRDIAPDNIFLRQTKPPILIDFGASRNALGSKSQNISAIVKHGYSPPEQYTSKSKQDSTTDLYAISAVIYEMITGIKPPESTYRQIEDYNGNQDPLEDIVNIYQNRFKESFLQTIVKGLSIKQKDRVQTIKEFQEGLVGDIKEIPPTPLPPTTNNRGIIIAILVSAIAIIGAIFLKDFINKDNNLTQLTKEQQLEVSCNIGNLKDCNKLGFMYHNGEGVEKDYTKASELYRKVCDGGDTKGCRNLGINYYKGEGVKKDKTKAIELFKKACDGDNAEACGILGSIYFIEGNYSKVIEFSKKACDGGDANGCETLGSIYDEGNGVKKDKTKAIEFYIKACDGDNAEACGILGAIYLMEKNDYIKGIEFSKKACDAGDGQGCNNLGVSYENGYGVEKDYTKAIELFNKACDDNDSVGCGNLGKMYYYGNGVKQDKTKAIEFFKKACDGGDGQGCNNLGVCYKNGFGIKKDLFKAVELFKKSCDGNYYLGCSNLGEMYKNGLGVVQDEVRAKQLFKKACDGGDANGCQNLK